MSTNSKIILQATLCSLLLHAFVLALFSIIKWRSTPATDVEIVFQNEQVALVTTRPDDAEIAPQSSTTEATFDRAPVAPEPVVSANAMDTAYVDTTKNFDRLTFFSHSPRLSFQRSLHEIEMDSLDSLANRPPTMLPFDSAKNWQQFNVTPGPYADRVQRGIEQQNLGQPRPLVLTEALNEAAHSLSDLLNKDRDEKPVRLDFVPSEVELDVLQIVWENDSATDIDIYAALDSSVRITAVDLNRTLEKLDQKGILRRSLVSPRNEFTLPLGKIEMSATNRRNRVYQYESRIDVSEVLRYLQAVLYETENRPANVANDTTRARFINGLKAKIMKLIDETG
ncbi:hypothetical protein JXA02_09770 [candidate division KSB1 bacterium]|nr:hypothetical protein [candidate division KSB1 bacterium]RQW04093.1 MAG: hypothetical protein EH222_11595 [candidate division KSB1 bacterium]